MHAHAVIGANYGDEGKGLVTDWLCVTEGADLVVRFNGGAQAGHTVETPSGERHVFHHLGSGTFAGAATYLSSHFICNPIQFNQEWKRISPLRRPHVYVDPDCLVTTPFDMIINQVIEDARAERRHGSCGLGINETEVRSLDEDYCLRVSHLGLLNAWEILRRIRYQWVPLRLNQLGIEMSAVKDHFGFGLMDAFMNDCAYFMKRARPVATEVLAKVTKSIVFEGAQGLMLDQGHPNFPHVTRSNTGIKNVIELLDAFKVEHLTAHYVTRPYLTRHGAGPMEHEWPLDEVPRWMNRFEDKTNVPHPFQGDLRLGALDTSCLAERISKDYVHIPIEKRMDYTLGLFVTCVNQITNQEKYHTLRGDKFIGLNKVLDPNDAIVDSIASNGSYQVVHYSNGTTRNYTRRLL